jgi:hypothetical protein
MGGLGSSGVPIGTVFRDIISPERGLRFWGFRNLVIAALFTAYSQHSLNLIASQNKIFTPPTTKKNPTHKKISKKSVKKMKKITKKEAFEIL